VNLWPADIVETYIQLRLKAHGDAQHVLPLCSPEERWERPSKFALMKGGNKRATSLHDTNAEAEKALVVAVTADIKNAASIRIEQRPAESIRCQQYCPARPVCSQADDLMKVTRVNFAA
jgi:hypothetical protein